jgi:predicted MFS family arabinose efflux permease
MTVAVRPPIALRRARIAAGVVFLVHGAAAGSFATRIPWIRDHLGLGSAALGLALVMPAIGALVTMPISGVLVHRRSGREVTRVLLGAACLALALPALAPGLASLCVLLALFGAAQGMADVAMNTQAVQVQERAGRSILSGLHGIWSLGALVGSGVGVVATRAEVGAPAHLALMAAALLVVGQLGAARLPAAEPVEPAVRAQRRRRPSWTVVLIGIIGFASIFGEAAAADWSGVYLRDVVGSSAPAAAAAYSAFACAMTIGRLLGDRLVDRFGGAACVRLSGVVGASGALLVALARAPGPAIAGFALIGAGVAIVVPLAFAAGGRSTEQAGHGVAGVATIAYGAGLSAPGAIGLLAELTSLSAAFAMVAVLLALITLGAAVLAR